MSTQQLFFAGCSTEIGRRPGNSATAEVMPTSPTSRAYLSRSARASNFLIAKAATTDSLYTISFGPFFSLTLSDTLIVSCCMLVTATGGPTFASPCLLSGGGSVDSSVNGTTQTSFDAVGGKSMPVSTMPNMAGGGHFQQNW